MTTKKIAPRVTVQADRAVELGEHWIDPGTRWTLMCAPTVKDNRTVLWVEGGGRDPLVIAYSDVKHETGWQILREVMPLLDERDLAWVRDAINEAAPDEAVLLEHWRECDERVPQSFDDYFWGALPRLFPALTTALESHNRVLIRRSDLNRLHAVPGWMPGNPPLRVYELHKIDRLDAGRYVFVVL
jgi:hypothetical protein